MVARRVARGSRRTVWWNGIAAIAAVHDVDWRALGLDFLDDPARGEPALEQQLTYYEESLDWAEERGCRPHEGARAALAWLRAEPTRAASGRRHDHVGRLAAGQPDVPRRRGGRGARLGDGRAR